MFVADFIKKLKPYEGGKPIEELARELNLNKAIIKLASNENPLGASMKAVEAIKNAAGSVYMYPDGNAYYLKNRLASKLGVNGDNIIFGNGSDELLELIYRVFATGKDDEILYCYPTFIEYKLLGMGFDKRLNELPLKDFRYDIDLLIENINDNTKIIFLNTPNNPTGTKIDKREIDRVIESAKNALVVIDEAYYEYAINEDDYEELLDLYKNSNVIILRTFSKAYGLAGLRIGYGIANKEIIDYLNRVRPPFNVNILAQSAALAALDDEEHISKSVELNRKGKQYLYNEFDEMGISYIKTYANFILFDVKTMDADDVYNNLLKKGVIVRSMAGYGYKNALRVTIGKDEENEIFIKALKEVLSV